MKKKLFMVINKNDAPIKFDKKDLSTGKREVLYFETKVGAKDLRDTLNREHDTPLFFVTRGPDNKASGNHNAHRSNKV